MEIAAGVGLDSLEACPQGGPSFFCGLSPIIAIAKIGELPSGASFRSAPYAAAVTN